MQTDYPVQTRKPGIEEKPLSASKYNVSSWLHKANICHSLPPDRTRRSIKEMIKGGNVGHEPRLEPCWIMTHLAPPKVAQPKPDSSLPLLEIAPRRTDIKGDLVSLNFFHGFPVSQNDFPVLYKYSSRSHYGYYTANK